ncbi:MAG TPA: hypothetical protein VGU44_04460 [Gammaproteobacteria bacterium]|nr:hypothetical protein [Gammaproteobacteria bacterium]
MANDTRLHNSVSLSNHQRLEHSILGSKAIVELLRHIPLDTYPSVKLLDCLRVLEAHLDDAIESARNCGEILREYSQSCNSNCA